MKKNLIFFYLSFFILLLIPIFDLVHSGLPMTHDGKDHVARIVNFYQNLQNGIIVPRWAPYLNWGYGHPILMFLYPFPSYIASFFIFLGFSFVESTKLVFATTYVASGITMFLFLRIYFARYASLFGALLYVYAPYRFVDLYVRGAIGEHVFFVFPPLVLLCIYYLSVKKNPLWLIGGSFSFAFLILSHNALSLMLMPIFLFYILYILFHLPESQKKYFIFHATVLLLCGFGVAAFFWIPAFFEGKYTLRDIVTKNEYRNRFSNIADFIWGRWSYGGSGLFTVQVGIIHWLVVLVGIVFLAFNKKKIILFHFFIFLAIVFFCVLFLMTSYSLFLWEMVTIFQKFQFPWRFLTVTVFISSLFGALVISLSPKKYQKLIVVVGIGIVVLLSKDYFHAKGYIVLDDIRQSTIYDGTTDTGESAPIWSVRFMEKRPTHPFEVINGNAIIIVKENLLLKKVYEIDAKERTRIKINTLYFPGWQVTENEIHYPIEFQDQNHRGLITFQVEKGKHTITVEFTDTKLRKIANSISIITISLFGVWLLLRRKNK